MKDCALRFTLYNPTKVHFGRGQIEQLPLAFPLAACGRFWRISESDCH